MLFIRLTAAAAGLSLLALTGCSLFGLGGGDEAAPSGVNGYVVGDEPLAVQAGSSILAQGGSAADAVTAMYFALTATYPVAAGLGGGGLCVVHDPASSRTQAIIFLSRDSVAGGAFGVPGNVRGFAVVHQSFGRLPWQRDVSPGEGYAATGFPISQALETRLRAAQNAIRLDANLSAEFLTEAGILKPAGTTVSNPELAATLSAIRIYGANALYRGAIASKLVAYSATQGGAFRLDELAGYPVERSEPQSVAIGSNTVYLPPRKTGAGAYLASLLSHVLDAQGQVAVGNNPAAAVATATKTSLDQFKIQSLPRDLGATGFAASDNTGQAAACAVTMNGAFGSGHTAAGTGVILARAPSSPEAGLSGAFLSPAIAVAGDGNTVSLVGAGAGGPNGTAALVYALLRVGLDEDILQPGHLHSTGLAPFNTVNVVACQQGTCAALPDPGAQGLGAEAVPMP
ncbi:MAG TPA: gamma-glutamyltransferase [Rhizomicrobium sp.]|nr:gamma-glutamyltransferase [Rhizomicrobium sp.]